MIINAIGLYKTRDGRKVEVRAIRGSSFLFPVMGDDTGTIRIYTLSGNHDASGCPSDLDLVAPWEDEPTDCQHAVAMEAKEELHRAQQNWPPMNSAHEGYAVILEELDELWQHVKMSQKKRDLTAMRKEAIQVAAMAMRFVIEICNEERGRK